MKFTVLIFILCVVTTSFSQSSNRDGNISERIKADKPTVYLEYFCQDKSKVYLRLYNNTIWPLAIKTDELYYPSKTPIKLRNGVSTFAAPNDKEIILQYRVEKFALPWENVKVPKIAYYDNGFLDWIASDDSVFFSVPIEYLHKDLQVFVRFNYEWEIIGHGVNKNNPEHRVSFRGIDLSDTKPLTCEKDSTAVR
jgi:hypothetical protein